uniref:Transmembrane protein n=1 Tax=Globisporangium ultimum (strain ATCC 200006 / CBS 805.95 / DAOM BR144) TaxID=431595 RepID=K3W660_GLOUD
MATQAAILDLPPERASYTSSVGPEHALQDGDPEQGGRMPSAADGDASVRGSTAFEAMKTPLRQNGHELEGGALVIIPWSFKVFYGMLTDCFPLFGYRRRPYMALGWATCLAFLVAMACTPIGKPYYPDPSFWDKENAHIDFTPEEKATFNESALNDGGKYVMMMFAAVGYVMSDVAADAVLVDVAQREPVTIRGQTQTAIYTVRTIFMVITNLFLAFCFNGKDYGGSYDFTLSFPQVMLVLAVCLAPVVPITWLFIQEEFFVSPGFRNYIRELWGVVQTRAVCQVIAYKFFSGVFENATFVSTDPVQRIWAKVETRNEKLATVLTYGIMAFTLMLTARYGLNWNWRAMLLVTMLTVVVLDAICMFSVTWDIVRNQFFWLGISVVEQLPQGINFIVATYVVVELAELGHEGAIYALLTTVNNLSDPFAKAILKQIDAHYDVTNDEISEDSRDTRMKVSATLFIMYGMKLFSLVFLPLLPPQKKATQHLKATGGSSRTLGFLTMAYVGFAMVWSVMTNLMTMYKSTSCLTIAGGSGCNKTDS